MTHIWRVRTRLPERFGQRCRVLTRGRMNSVLVEFEDGVRHVTSRWNVRRLNARRAADEIDPTATTRSMPVTRRVRR